MGVILHIHDVSTIARSPLNYSGASVCLFVMCVSIVNVTIALGTLNLLLPTYLPNQQFPLPPSHSLYM